MNRKQEDPKIKRLEAQIELMQTVINTAYCELDALWSFHGKNLDVTNWHQNGDLEPLDSFFEENNYGALEMTRQYKK